MDAGRSLEARHPFFQRLRGENGEVDPARLLAAFAALIVGFVSKRAMAAILAGIAVLYVMLWWLG